MNLESKLNHHNIRPTAVRLLILRQIEQSEFPISALDIETALETVDRSTITRTLALLSEADIIHAIHDGSSAVKYELCPALDDHSIHDHHLHFHCRRCEKTFCLPGAPLPQINLPAGYQGEKADFVVTGLCPGCSSKP
ncbi:MAG: transcriptional repressor [Prevotella sp.]|nr:transcriptional repressor [Bacteroides sp.]MCM1366106.1 transcriptional repressor [Prevotella sp.]MCM1436591.1 transcriptional repressor [Prevotella sp.]